jgi:EAL domain-containing protein (putative c-di-GMP-specific phosphodiesterase class I)/CheY-like chemotaxis protein
MNNEQNFTDTAIHSGWAGTSGAHAIEHELTGPGHSMPKVLFVDDDQAVVDGLRRALSEYPYHVQTATSAEHALQKLGETPFDVIVADERMPGMRGSELLTVIANEFPTTGRILLTGHGTVEVAARAINQAGVIRILLKPCPVAELRDAIETALKTTPHEKRVRTGARRAYLVSHRDPPPAAELRRPGEGHGPEATEDGGRDCARRPSERGRAGHNEWEANELVLQAQKVLELGSENLFGYELSTRLQTQSGNIHTIGNFIASSGQHLLLSSVDRWVVRHVLKLVHEHEHILERRGLTVSLNLAAQSLADPEFVEFLDAELSNVGIAGRFLIELREAALAKSLRRDEGLLARLLTLRCYEWGTRLAIDGVGGALWKFEVLKNLPVALAKIDSRFVCDILTNQQSESLVRSAVEWGQRAGVAVAATGIDTPAIAERLRFLGVHYGQGSVFGTAEPVGLTLTGLYS